MELLIAFFGFFTLMSVVALIKFQGNPLFLFSLLLSVASLIWLVQAERQGTRSAPRKRAGGRARGRARGRRSPR